MINEQKEIEITNEDGKVIKVKVILIFQIPDLNKHYIVYTFGKELENNQMEIYISEFDSELKQIRPIGDEEKELVIDYYNQIKNSLL